jgi:hypothetical protein
MSQPGIIHINFPPKTKNTKREPPTPQLTKNQLLITKTNEKQTGKNEKKSTPFRQKNCQL